MSVRGLAMALALASPSVGSAEEMQVRAGEHPDFTRLVLAFDALPDWRAGRSDDGYTILFDGDEPLVTDLSRTFALIRRDRISAIDVARNGRRVYVTLACDCHAEMFALNGVSLVIDIRDGATGPTARHEAPLEPLETARATPRVSIPALGELAAPPPVPPRTVLGGRPDMPVQRPPIPPAIAPEPWLSQIRPTAADLDPAREADLPVADRPVFASTDIDPLFPAVDTLPTVNSAAIEALTQQFSRAAVQGLIDVDPVPEPRPQTLSSIPGPNNFRITTGIDRATGRVAKTPSAVDRAGGCLPSRYVDVLAWGDPKGAKDLAKLRKAVIRETGAIDEDAMLALARYYVLLGFGAEARFAADYLPDSLDREAVLALADVIDHAETDRTIFDGQLACPGEVALWAALSGPFSRAELPVSTDGILTAFSALPPHLREHLGPTLSQRLRSAGETALARAALSAVTRAGSGSVGQELTAARLELLGTRAEAARAELERIAQGTNMAAAEALIELLRDAERRRVPPKPDWVDDAAALIRVTDGTRTSEELSIAALRGHIPLGRFDDLRRALTEGRPGLTEIVRRDIAADALSQAVGDADAETFIRAELGFSDFALPDALDTSVRYNFVARFLDMSLPRLAAKYLPPEAETIDEVRLTAATISALNRRREALRLVEESDEASLADLRAALLEDLGRYPDAAMILQEIGAGRAAELQALRSGNWNWIAEAGPNGLSQVARDATSGVQGDGAALPDNSRLIEEVSRRRAAYLDLLTRTQPSALR